MIYQIQYSLLKRTLCVFSPFELDLTKAGIAEIDGEKRYCTILKRMPEESVSSTELGTNHIIRQATVSDEIHHDLHIRKCCFYIKEANRLAKELSLECRFIAAEPLFDLRRIQFYFKAYEPVTFRRLAKKLRDFVKTQIDLQQVEGRDIAKLVSDIGMCNGQTCCTRFLYETPIINEQDVKNIWTQSWQSLGVCNRIKCCATFEKQEYNCTNCNNCEQCDCNKTQKS